MVAFLTRVDSGLLVFFSCLFSLFCTFCGYIYFRQYLPRDHGRAYAVEGSVSKNKPTGAGVVFVISYLISVLLFLPWKTEFLILYGILISAMITGFLDDGAAKPWRELKKGLWDLVISFGVSCVFAFFVSTDIVMPLIGISFTIPIPLFIFLATVFVWGAINVTNCSDGVDGLSSSLIIISLLSIFAYSFFLSHIRSDWTGRILPMVFALLIYLGFNTNPSLLLMGDAGSRPLGVFLAVSFLYAKNPFAFFTLCFVIFINGGASIVKLSLKRYLKISILKNTITPIHDHLRKNKGWSNPQVTGRLSVLHMILCICYLMAIYLIT